MFQSTRPRGARLSIVNGLFAKISVSIHAPAWGATELAASSRRLLAVSIHAPAWGATYYNCSYIRLFRVSIHAPAWGATHGRAQCVLQYEVSIHAPAWGATQWHVHGHTRRSGFNPRARVGRDKLKCTSFFLDVSFNPRARVGRDTGRRCRSPARRCFNPRARVGRDRLLGNKLKIKYEGSHFCEKKKQKRKLDIDKQKICRIS